VSVKAVPSAPRSFRSNHAVVSPPAPPSKRQSAAPTPQDDEQRTRQGRDHRLGQQPEPEEAGGQQVRSGLSPFVEAEVDEERAQVEDRGQRVLLLRDPGDRLHADRMQGEDRRGDRGAGHVEPAQHEEQQYGRQGMQGDVDQVVRRLRIAPRNVLDPERGMEQRVVLLGRARLEPDAPQTVRRSQLGSGHMRIVVPKEMAVDGGCVREQGRDRKRYPEPQDGRPPMLRERLGSLRRRARGLVLGRSLRSLAGSAWHRSSPGCRTLPPRSYPRVSAPAAPPPCPRQPRKPRLRIRRAGSPPRKRGPRHRPAACGRPRPRSVPLR
jgi:hypothetical protein